MANQTADAVESAGQPAPATTASGVDLNVNPDAAGTLETKNGTLTLEVPATGDASRTIGGVVFDSSAECTSAVVQTTERGGLRALIHIDSPDAPERFAFPLGGDVASVELDSTGGVAALDAFQVVNHRGGGFGYGITADPWWNPFSSPWGKWLKATGKTLGSALQKCGVGAVGTTLGLGAGTAAANFASRSMEVEL